MIIFAAIYWSVILLLGIFFFIKSLKGIYEYILLLCRKWILTRIFIALPLRLVVNIIASIGIGIMIFFHVLFFVCIITLIYVFVVETGDNSSYVSFMSFICLFSLFSPVVYLTGSTIYSEYLDFKQTT